MNLHGTYHHNLIAHNDSHNMHRASRCEDNGDRNNVFSPLPERLIV